MKNALRILLVVSVSWALADDLVGQRKLFGSLKKGKIASDHFTPYLDQPYVDPDDDAHDRKHHLDLFVPVGVDNPPLLVYLHGGGWIAGGRSFYRWVGREFTRKGWAVAVPSYRLSPAVKHPAHADDCARAVGWLAQEHKRFGFDPKRIVLSGHSAGGHLCAYLALERKTLAKHGVDVADQVIGVIPMSGVYDLTPELPMFEKIFGEEAGDRALASPVTLVHEGAPPFLVMWADRDYEGLGDMGRTLTAKLEQAKVSVRSVEVPGTSHNSLLRRTHIPEHRAGKEFMGFLERLNPPRAAGVATDTPDKHGGE